MRHRSSVSQYWFCCQASAQKSENCPEVILFSLIRTRSANYGWFSHNPARSCPLPLSRTLSTSNLISLQQKTVISLYCSLWYSLANIRSPARPQSVWKCSLISSSFLIYYLAWFCDSGCLAASLSFILICLYTPFSQSIYQAISEIKFSSQIWIYWPPARNTKEACLRGSVHPSWINYHPSYQTGMKEFISSAQIAFHL